MRLKQQIQESKIVPNTNFFNIKTNRETQMIAKTRDYLFWLYRNKFNLMITICTLQHVFVIVRNLLVELPPKQVHFRYNLD